MLCQKKWCYRVLLILGMLVLGGCGKDRKNVSESAYSVKEEAYSSNYSCKDKDGRDIMGNKAVYSIEQKEEMTEGQKLEVIARLVGADGKKDGAGQNTMPDNVIEAEAHWKGLDGKEKIYLLRGKKLESYVTEEEGKETYQERSRVK